MIGYPRGSEWRKWDLHIHTPEAMITNGFGNDEESWKKYIKILKDSDVKVFGITDYFSASNYFSLLEKIQKFDQALLQTKVFFLNIEFRLDISTNRNSEEINIHIVFDNLCERASIEKFLFSLETVNKKTDGTYYSCSPDDLKEIGYPVACTSMKNIETALTRTFGNTKPYIIIAAANGYGGIRADSHSPRKLNLSDEVDKFCDMFFGRAQDKSYFLGDSRFENKSIKSTPKPVISGSDCHSFEDCEKYLGKQYVKSGVLEKDITWIKADPTFLGILQLTYEPKDRVFIGEKPEQIKQLEAFSTHYASSISIHNIAPGTKPSWFESDIELNPGLVAIIGKKGSGKSALADIIALSGNSHMAPDNYSFLIDKKFRKKNQAKSYEANLGWVDKKFFKVNLNDDVDIFKTEEKVKYLPQKFVETICGEDGVSLVFQEEIGNVIYSYVPEEERIGTTKLQELITHKTEIIDHIIGQLRDSLSDTNFQIVSLEKKLLTSYQDQIKGKLEERKRELDSLKVPKEVKAPKDAVNNSNNERLKKLSEEIDKLGITTSELKSNLANVNVKIASLERVSNALESLEEKVSEFLGKYKKDADNISIKFEEIVNLKIRKTELDKIGIQLNKEKDKLTFELDPSADVNVSIARKHRELTAEYDALLKLVDSDAKQYQEYKKELERYENRKKAIIGNQDNPTPESIVSLEHEIKYISDEVPKLIEKLKAKRLHLSFSLFKELGKKIKFFAEIYKPLAQFIEIEREEQEKTGNILKFDVGYHLDKTTFIDGFLSFLNLQKDGSFQTKEGAQKVTKKILERAELTTEEGVKAFLDDVEMHLVTHRGEENVKTMSLDAQLKDGTNTKHNLYNFLFGLEYLDVKYKVIFNGKDLNDNEFSPGEKGALLLIFYLLIDKSRIPLVMDQPEENLDNESVFTLLVPYIKKIKETRQIIIVTHNPNLAVVCDAEQIISTKMDKKTNEVRYISGSIENPDLNDRLASILEGTLPAFDIRDSKYIRK